MGREKRKGKEVVVEKPVRKRTRAEREAERAEMVAKAAEEQASGRQGSASQGQGQRSRYGPSQRCQGHQSHDRGSSRVRSVNFSYRVRCRFRERAV